MDMANAIGHLRLWLLRGALALVQRSSAELAPFYELLVRFPALRVQIDAAARAGLDGLTLDAALARLDARLCEMDGGSAAALPLSRLRRALDLDAEGLCAFLTCALS